jgi:flagellar basal body-associated protein FliL
MATDPTEDPKPRSRALQIAVPIVAALVGVGGTVAAMTFLGGGKDEEAEATSEEGAATEAAAEGEAPEGEAAKEGEGAAAEGAEAAGKAGRPKPGEATITSLGSFTVNLRGSGGGRVLRVEVQVETSGAASETVAARTVQLRDSVITAISDYTWTELEGTDGKVRLRDELLQRANGITAPAVIERLYFTQFVVQ